MDAPAREALAEALVRMGCPQASAGTMAAQLEKRAVQIAAQTGRTPEDALGHLLRLMAEGGAIASGGAAAAPIRPWEKLGRKVVADHRIFQICTQRLRSPRTGQEHDYVILDAPAWVNVIALTPARELVMIEQYRAGSDTVELEIPGGMMDLEDADPVAAGARELREETGYEGSAARLLGRILPNPAIQNNVCHTVIIEACELKHPTEFDSGEDLVTRLVPAAEIPRLLSSGKIQHALVFVALCQFEAAQREGRLA